MISCECSERSERSECTKLPVPPLEVGNAVPERVNAKFAFEVGLVIVVVRNAGVVALTDVTVPVPGKSVCHEVWPAPSVCRNCPTSVSDVAYDFGGM